MPSPVPHHAPPRLGALFTYDWDAIGFARQRVALDRAGFDLFGFPSDLRLVGFDLERFAAAQARRAAAGLASSTP